MKKHLFTPLMRNIAFVLAACFVFGLSASARTVSLEEAMAKAQRFLYSNSADSVSQARGLSTATFKLAYEAKTASKTVSCFYVLNQTSSEGYVIVSADDRLPEVLGYSNSGEFDINKIPDNMKWWLSEYERQIEQVLASPNNNSVMPTAETSFRDGWTEIEPLVKTKWNQSEPYNNQCPTINGNKTLTGCVATAMAQIMKYHQWPVTGRGSHSYEWSGGQTLSMDFSKVTFDWENMLDIYSEVALDYDLNETTTNEQYLIFTDFKLSSTYKYYIEASRLTNITASALNGELQLLLADNDGKFIRPVGEKNDITNLSSRSYWPAYGIYHYPLTSGDLPDGLYRLYLGFKPSGSTEWSMVQRATDESNIYQSSTWEEYYITISKSGAYYTIEDNTYACSYSKTQGNAVATLMHTCGISVDMNYGLGASGAITYYATQALNQYFDYNAKWLDRENVELLDWENLIYTELQNNRPILYSGRSNAGGHAFVCDGYSDNGYFHINWGWGGYLDGNFLLSVLDPYEGVEGREGNGYQYDQAIIYGIRPIEKVEIDGVYYSLIKEDGEAFVSTPDEGYYTGELTIPAKVTYEGKTYTVMDVDNNIWGYCQDLTSLIVYAPINEITTWYWDVSKSPNLNTVKLFNVIHIASWAFGNCENLKTLELGDNLETIGYCAFYNCSALTELTIPNKVESIDGYAFANGSSLEKIVIPNSVKTIGNYAFYGGSTTRTIISQIEEPFDLPANTFSNNAFTRDVLYVPYGTTEKYQAKEVWKNFTNIKESDPTTITISVGADGLASYCPQFGVDFSNAEHIAAYKASVNGSTVNLTKVMTVAAGEGVLLRSLSGGATQEILPVAEATKNEGNAFVGTLEDVILSETEGSVTNFVLSKVDGVVGFYKANGTKVVAGKAYLPVENYQSGARGLTVMFDDTTSISEVESQQSTIDDAIYTLGGVRVKNPTKGLYIKNGKKVVIK